jgi:muramoyltetrapeptide carboxypeptidase LdcA involved in peptidoglycan recycling
MKQLSKLKAGDKIAVLSPSFAAPGMFPEVYELGLKRIKEIFGLVPIEFPTTKKFGASKDERAGDLIAAFENPEIKAVMASIGGNDQVTYVKNLPSEPFANNPKPFLGYSDNTHFLNFLWLNGVPSFYGGSLMTQCAMQGRMDDYTVNYVRKALFETGESEIMASDMYYEIGLDWKNPDNLAKERIQEKNDGWYWNNPSDAQGITWGGCLESIDEILRHGVRIPTMKDFENIILMLETSEEIPSADYVFRVLRALGERGILANIRAVIVGRPKAWEFNKQNTKEERTAYCKNQRETILKAVRSYNQSIPIVQNLNFGHTDPQIPFPYGMPIRIDGKTKKIYVFF